MTERTPAAPGVDEVCRHCGVFSDQHDYEHLARECYPKRIEALEAAIEQALKEIDDPARCVGSVGARGVLISLPTQKLLRVALAKAR